MAPAQVQPISMEITAGHPTPSSKPGDDCLSLALTLTLVLPRGAGSSKHGEPYSNTIFHFFNTRYICFYLLWRKKLIEVIVIFETLWQQRLP